MTRTAINLDANELHLQDQKLKAMQAAFSCLLTKTPSLEMIKAYETSDSEELTSFCVNHLRKEIVWSTGIGVVDAARTIAEEAINNANIGSEHSYYPPL